LHAETVFTVLARCIRPQRGTDRWDDFDLIECISVSRVVEGFKSKSVSASNDSPLLRDPVSGDVELEGRDICKAGWVCTFSKKDEI
jgi:hypothetical protein